MNKVNFLVFFLIRMALKEKILRKSREMSEKRQWVRKKRKNLIFLFDGVLLGNIFRSKVKNSME